MADLDSFPRREARTQRFTLGAPRNFKVSSDGHRIAFLRSSGPTDPVNSLWLLDVASGNEQLVADPHRLCSGTAGGADATELSAAERALRERLRETGAGIVSYDCDPQLTVAVFVLAGKLWRVDLATGEALALPAEPDAFDPRLAPDRELVSYVSGPAVRVTGDTAGDREVISEQNDNVSWGSAEFVAAEEMGRRRGHWWSPDSRHLLAARVDTSPVNEWWISAPAAPDSAPTAIRYPAAGTANAYVGLAVISIADTIKPQRPDASRNADPNRLLDSRRADPATPQRVDVAWNADSWEYLAGVRWSTEGLLLTVQSRDQRTVAVLNADTATGDCSTLYQWRDEAWVELVPGTPQLAEGRLITVEDRGSARRLCVDGEALTSDLVQVRNVVQTDSAGILVTASADPTEVHVAHVSWDGDFEWLTSGSQVNSTAAGGNTMVVAQRSLSWPGPRVTVLHRRQNTADRPDEGLPDEATLPSGASPVSEPAGHDGHESSQPQSRALHRIACRAAVPGLELNVRIITSGPRDLATAVILPCDARPDEPLPVLLDPYGGPHAQRVLQAQNMYYTSQWFAEQGFAVVVIDGRGTPGRGPEFERAVRGDLAGPVLEDQIEGLQTAASQERRLDLSRVAVRGWSFGGYLAALAVLNRPDVFHAAIAGAPVTDWRLYDTHYTERYLGHPNEELHNYERTELLRLAPQLRRPLMLIHGLADDNVLSAHTLRLSQALTNAGRLHTVIPLSGITHMTPQPQVAESLLHLQLSFLRSALLQETLRPRAVKALEPHSVKTSTPRFGLALFSLTSARHDVQTDRRTQP